MFLYKTYKANRDGEYIPTPVHAVTFNGLGYNKAVYTTLDDEVFAGYSDKLTNFYYYTDLVGEGLGEALLFKRPGNNTMLYGKNINGEYLRTEKELNTFVAVRDLTYHGIEYFQNDFDLLYNSTHNFPYWISPKQ